MEANTHLMNRHSQGRSQERSEQGDSVWQGSLFPLDQGTI